MQYSTGVELFRTDLRRYRRMGIDVPARGRGSRAAHREGCASAEPGWSIRLHSAVANLRVGRRDDRRAFALARCGPLSAAARARLHGVGRRARRRGRESLLLRDEDLASLHDGKQRITVSTEPTTSASITEERLTMAGRRLTESSATALWGFAVAAWVLTGTAPGVYVND